MEVLGYTGNVYDGTQALTLIENFKKSYDDAFQPKYYTMNSAYDFESNHRNIIEHHKGSRVIAYNPRRGSKTPSEGMNDHFQPICSAGYPMTYYG